MSLVPPNPFDEQAHAIVRELANTTADSKRRARMLRLADALEMASQLNTEAEIQEALDRLSLGQEVLTFARDIRDDRIHTTQRFNALYEHNQRQDEQIANLITRIETLERDCSELRAAQEPNSLAERLRGLSERPMTALERVEAIRHALTELQTLLQAAQRDAFIEATAENARRMLEVAEQVQDEVATLRAEVAELRKRLGD